MRTRYVKPVGVRFRDLARDHCRYLIRPTRYCGAPIKGRGPWCEEHAAVCVRGNAMSAEAELARLK